MDADKIDDAKAQVQGQLAAQYIQDVMQELARFEHLAQSSSCFPPFKTYPL